MFEDTYFLNVNEAIRVAKEENMINDQRLQMCYYNGEKIESECENLDYLPIEDMVNVLALGTKRLPTKINFEGLEISQDVKGDIEQHFSSSLNQAKSLREELNKHYLSSARTAKLDFTEPLRIYFITSAYTRVLQHVSKNIADAFKRMGYNVLFELDDGTRDPHCIKGYKEFNPHIIININNINNKVLNDEVFNFVWFQDVMPILTDSSKIHLRKRDFIFHLIGSIGDRCKNKGLASQYQGFCVNTNVYKPRESIERKNKIVMIGSSYKKEFELVQNKRKNEIAEMLLQFYTSNEVKTKESRQNYFTFLKKKYNINDGMELGHIQNYILRDGFLLYIAKMNLDFELEIYGWGWEKQTELKKYFKGVLSYGEEISKVYNSAKYSLVLGGYVKQQRTLESAASGCIPLVHDNRYNNVGDKDDTCVKESLVFFNRPDDIPSLLKMNHNVDLNCIVNANSYEHLVNRFINIIREKM